MPAPFAHSLLLLLSPLLGPPATLTASVPPPTPAQNSPRSKAFVVAAPKGGQPTDRARQLRLGTVTTLYAVVKIGDGRRAMYYTDAATLSLGGRRIRARQRRPLSSLGKVGVSWYQVEPRQQHHKLPSVVKGSSIYSNSVMYGPRHGRWLGYDRIEYYERPIVGASAGRLVVMKATPSHPKVNVHGGLGTMRYKVTVRWSGRAKRRAGRATSSGAEASTTRGISPGVLRLSWRSGSDAVGWLTSFYNVPYVFGSAGPGRRHQTDLYQGTDCADVMTGALRQAGLWRVKHTYVVGLSRIARPVTKRLRIARRSLTWVDGPRKGQAARLRFGRDVRRGDLILIDFEGAAELPRSWDHVAMVARDVGTKGRFDPADRVLHMGFEWGLTEQAAGLLGPATIQILRFKPWIQRRLSPPKPRRRAPRRP